jgi:hypothetical protein
MSDQRNTRFDPHFGLPSPSHFPDLVLGPVISAGSEDDLSEKDKGFHLPKEEEFGTMNRPKSLPWTSRPQALKERLKLRWWRELVVDIFSLLMPMPFLLLAIILLYANGKKTSDRSFIVVDQSVKVVSNPMHPD